MRYIVFASDLILPMLLFFIAGNALLQNKKGFDAFTRGVKDGFSVVAEVLPTLIGLLVAAGVLRASGFLDALARWLTPLVSRIAFPAALLPMVLVKLLSSSAATSLLLDIYKQFGTDSYEGFLASVIMSSTETVFYTMAVYYASVRVTKTRYTLAGALLATGSGIVFSTIFCLILYKN